MHAYDLLMFFPQQPGGWGALVEYDLSEAQREALTRASLLPLSKRCELVGGFDEWRLHVDYVLAVGSSDWVLRSGCFSRRSSDITPIEFRDWLRSRTIPDTILLRAAEVGALMKTPPSAWEDAWVKLRKRRKTNGRK
jgi:hypothetical protein